MKKLPLVGIRNFSTQNNSIIKKRLAISSHIILGVQVFAELQILLKSVLQKKKEGKYIANSKRYAFRIFDRLPLRFEDPGISDFSPDALKTLGPPRYIWNQDDRPLDLDDLTKK